MNARFLAFLPFFALVFLMSVPAYAQGVLGHIVSAKGAVEISQKGNTADVSGRTAFYLGDVIETGDDGRVAMEFTDGTELTLGENAQLTVDEFLVDAADSQNNKARFSILRGAFMFASGLVGKANPPNVEIETTYGSIGIRGTRLWGGVVDMGDDYNAAARMGGMQKQFGVYVEEGAVAFTTNNGESIVKEGYGSFVKNRNGVPSVPRIWTTSQIMQIKGMAAGPAE